MVHPSLNAECPVDETVDPVSPVSAATAFNIITASASVFPRERKVISNSADLVAKLADPPTISIRKTMKMNYTLLCSCPKSIHNQHNYESVAVSKSHKSIPENQFAEYVVS